MEVLHETWLRIGRIGDVGLVERPEAYLFRMALNVAADRKQAEKRKLTDGEIATLRHMMDDVLDPERIAEARADMASLEDALNELTFARRYSCSPASRK
ncbi:hypothetical protein [Bradyrhizobium sp. STM 3562]|uniref:hypothetical protein n=1 Tax=Bradyrhizobium sp. STM 3562 TaxID=578924 RepID=UPI0038901AC8